MKMKNKPDMVIVDETDFFKDTSEKAFAFHENMRKVTKEQSMRVQGYYITSQGRDDVVKTFGGKTLWLRILKDKEIECSEELAKFVNEEKAKGYKLTIHTFEDVLNVAGLEFRANNESLRPQTLYAEVLRKK